MDNYRDAHGRFASPLSAQLSAHEEETQKMALHLLDHHMHGGTAPQAMSIARVLGAAGEQVRTATNEREYDAALALKSAAGEMAAGRGLAFDDLTDAAQPRGPLARAALHSAYHARAHVALRPALRLHSLRAAFGNYAVPVSNLSAGLSASAPTREAHLHKRQHEPGKRYLGSAVTPEQYERLARAALRDPAADLSLSVSHGRLLLGVMRPNKTPSHQRGMDAKTHTYSILNALRGNIITHHDALGKRDVKLPKGVVWDDATLQ